MKEIHSSTYCVCNVTSCEAISNHQVFVNLMYPSLPFLYTIWKFHKNLMKPRYIVASCNTSLMDVSKWLTNCFEDILPTIHDIWKELFKGKDVQTFSSWNSRRKICSLRASNF
ncbi:hypothetical protein KP509_33G049900 [Ceratopteris richardii]|uniref:Uncharacterized protein n=1 Tax=Ceratopteris richardii TaxID=49495 RepID=A0A8T2QRA7_CERRI|nr:hypothetical protein KP509_33G049900 [Ceratopteris richardii]